MSRDPLQPPSFKEGLGSFRAWSHQGDPSTPLRSAAPVGAQSALVLNATPQGCVRAWHPERERAQGVQLLVSGPHAAGRDRGSGRTIVRPGTVPAAQSTPRQRQARNSCSDRADAFPFGSVFRLVDHERGCCAEALTDLKSSVGGGVHEEGPLGPDVTFLQAFDLEYTIRNRRTQALPLVENTPTATNPFNGRSSGSVDSTFTLPGCDGDQAVLYDQQLPLEVAATDVITLKLTSSALPPRAKIFLSRDIPLHHRFPRAQYWEVRAIDGPELGDNLCLCRARCSSIVELLRFNVRPTRAIASAIPSTSHLFFNTEEFVPSDTLSSRFQAADRAGCRGAPTDGPVPTLRQPTASNVPTARAGWLARRHAPVSLAPADMHLDQVSSQNAAPGSAGSLPHELDFITKVTGTIDSLEQLIQDYERRHPQCDSLETEDLWDIKGDEFDVLNGWGQSDDEASIADCILARQAVHHFEGRVTSILRKRHATPLATEQPSMGASQVDPSLPIFEAPRSRSPPLTSLHTRSPPFTPPFTYADSPLSSPSPPSPGVAEEIDAGQRIPCFDLGYE